MDGFEAVISARARAVSMLLRVLMMALSAASSSGSIGVKSASLLAPVDLRRDAFRRDRVHGIGSRRSGSVAGDTRSRQRRRAIDPDDDAPDAGGAGEVCGVRELRRCSGFCKIDGGGELDVESRTGVSDASVVSWRIATSDAVSAGPA